MSCLTAVVPVWDSYIAYLPQCLDAIRAQEVDASIVVVDNASTVELAPLGQDVTVIRTPGRVSAGAARNAGLAAVTTSYVVFADADDTVLPGTWAFLLSRLDADPGLVAAAAQLWWVDDETHERRPAPSPRPHVFRLNGRRRLFAAYMALRMALPAHDVTVFRTDVVVEAGGFGDGNLAEDWSLSAAVALRGRVEQHRRPGAEMRLHRGSLFNRSLSRAEQSSGMRDVRRRLRGDARTPAWLRASLGPIAAFHELKAVANSARPAFIETGAGR